MQEGQNASADGGAPAVADGTQGASQTNGETTHGVSLEERLARLEEKNRELLGMNKKLKGILDEKDGTLQQIEHDKLKAQGDKDAIIESLRSRTQELEGKYREQQEAYTFERVSSQVRSAAQKVGCVDSEALMRLMDWSDVDHRDFQINADDLKYKLEEARKSYPYLFGNSTPNLDHGSPGAPKPSKGFKFEEWAKDKSVGEILAKAKELGVGHSMESVNAKKKF